MIKPTGPIEDLMVAEMMRKSQMFCGSEISVAADDFRERLTVSDISLRLREIELKRTASVVHKRSLLTTLILCVWRWTNYPFLKSRMILLTSFVLDSDGLKQYDRADKLELFPKKDETCRLVLCYPLHAYVILSSIGLARVLSRANWVTLTDIFSRAIALPLGCHTLMWAAEVYVLRGLVVSWRRLDSAFTMITGTAAAFQRAADTNRICSFKRHTEIEDESGTRTDTLQREIDLALAGGRDAVAEMELALPLAQDDGVVFDGCRGEGAVSRTEDEWRSIPPAPSRALSVCGPLPRRATL